MVDRIYNFIYWLIIFAFSAFILTGSTTLPSVEADKFSVYTREIEFNFWEWTSDALWLKLQQAALGSPYYIEHSTRKEIVASYFEQMEQVLYTEWELEQIYTNPEINDPALESTELRNRLDILYAEQSQLAPFAESVLEIQISVALAEASLTLGGQPIPRPLYHISPLPMNLIISPREIIRQDRSIMLLADFPVDKRDELEESIATDLGVSALVEPVGGIGIYPAMGMRTTNLPWTLNTIAHEWTHNYLEWHPLGWNYSTSPELRTINETVASIVGREISLMVLERDYPEFLAGTEHPRVHLLALNEPSLGVNFNLPQNSMHLAFWGTEEDFDFRAEMHKTRLRVDELLAEGKIEEAETYMEERRQFMWANGYAIRKLNQAYFAFHGAYADIPGGAAGTDPVGPAVRKLREQSDSLADFVHKIMWVTSFEELLEMVE